MKDLKEMDFDFLKNNFEEICDETNSSNNAATLTLKSGKKVFILPEANYNSISHFVIINTSSNALTK